MLRMMLVMVIFSLASFTANADESAFHAGTLISEFGEVASVDSDLAIPRNARFKVRFDVRTQADAGEINRSLETAARFLNMHGENGVALENMNLAIVIHGGAVKDVTKPERYEALAGAGAANAPLIAALLEKGVEIYVCGQSAAYYDVAKEDLVPGVQMALSAMTAHALLDAKGYALNPF